MESGVIIIIQAYNNSSASKSKATLKHNIVGNNICPVVIQYIYEP